MSVLSLMQRLVLELTRVPEVSSEIPELVVENGAVRVERDRYARIASREARVAFLRSAAERADRIELHVSFANDGTHTARLLVDGPRRVLRFLGRNVPEPGDRFGEGFVHRFFDEEELLREIDRAGLALVERHGETFVLERRRATSTEDADAFALEVARVLSRIVTAERARLRSAPESAVRAMRDHGRHAPDRGPIGRARLRRAIGWVDACFPGGPSCYRRTLLELSLDGRAAKETIVFGLDVGRTGHVAFKDTEDRTFDVAYEIEG